MNNSKPFEITTVCKEDIVQLINSYVDDEDDEKYYKKIVENMDDAHMKQLASEMADDYCGQLFWDSLSVIFFENLASKFAEDLKIIS